MCTKLTIKGKSAAFGLMTFGDWYQKILAVASNALSRNEQQATRFNTRTYSGNSTSKLQPGSPLIITTTCKSDTRNRSVNDLPKPVV